MTACFSEYSHKLLDQSRSKRIPIREQLKQAAEHLAKDKAKQKAKGVPEKSVDFSGRGGATERTDFGRSRLSAIDLCKN